MNPLPNRHLLVVMCLAVGLVHCAAETSSSSFSNEPPPDLVQAPIDDSPDGRRASPPSEPTNDESGSGGVPCGRPTGYDEIMIDGKPFRVPYFEACRQVGPRDLVDPQPF